MNARSRARYETMCRTCGQIVGVRTTPFNKVAPSEVVWKTTGHKTLDGRGRCPGSMLSVDPAAAFERRTVEVEVEVA